ncbi:hypothetical protein [Deinococcus cellulosilyticus]|uniref:Uncharacterized protein n=1 Tax=Deinococcus cellulosilyticus (strain DSM 18568 / NBRC 106333 / KACC 11606 / 5516J-15) TaxID=1223518 RepID=A0A511N713_DEIC1|nr:hypothetical protein [Deinococcus cellulosilyticus]GEM48642.1 hypothetical protein DC3_42770 [Deinococcus cellulosilyticus NBRC 106333 = KACC 11606]
MTHITQLDPNTSEPKDFLHTYQVLKQLSATPTTVGQLMFRRGIKKSYEGSATVRHILHWAAQHGLVTQALGIIKGKEYEVFSLTIRGETWLDNNWVRYNSQLNPTVYARWQALNSFRTCKEAMDMKFLRRLVKLGFVWENPDLRGQFHITHAGLDWLRAHDHLFALSEEAA